MNPEAYDLNVGGCHYSHDEQPDSEEDWYFVPERASIFITDGQTVYRKRGVHYQAGVLAAHSQVCLEEMSQDLGHFWIANATCWNLCQGRNGKWRRLTPLEVLALMAE